MTEIIHAVRRRNELVGKVESASRARAIAFYLPQYHPVPENDEWWGKGFTEWTNAAKARPLFRGHYQPHLPADLGFYDLRVRETREEQARLAARYGIFGFCYYHYWFAGRQILQRPFAEVLNSGSPQFPFCLCWANETWSGVWSGAPGRTLIEQTYPGETDHAAHFQALLPAFTDPRYILVEGKPLFLIYRPEQLPNANKVLEFWRGMATDARLPGLHIVGMSARPEWMPNQVGFDAKLDMQFIMTRPWVSRRTPVRWIKREIEILRGLPTTYSYEKFIAQHPPTTSARADSYPSVVHSWDNTPRSGRSGVVLHGASPGLFRMSLETAVRLVENRSPDRRLVFLKAWNEWAEGNHLEPDLKHGHSYLDVVREVLTAKADENENPRDQTALERRR